MKRIKNSLKHFPISLRKLFQVIALKISLDSHRTNEAYSSNDRLMAIDRSLDEYEAIV